MPCSTRARVEQNFSHRPPPAVANCRERLAFPPFTPPIVRLYARLDDVASADCQTRLPDCSGLPAQAD